jgi:undecaprenyl pyrophosphate phosphatase UppP
MGYIKIQGIIDSVYTWLPISSAFQTALLLMMIKSDGTANMRFATV